MSRFCSLFLALVLLAGCAPDPTAEEFAAPRLGAVQVEAEAFQARISCPVEGNVAGVVSYGFRLGEATSALIVNTREIPATLANGKLTATVKGLSPETIYQIDAFLGNCADLLVSENVAFRTEEGPEVVDIPDLVFRRFILANFDENHDDVFTVPEAQKITELSVCTDSIYSLKGIEKMSRLKKLVADGSPWGYGQLQEIDLSGNPLLDYCHIESNQLHTVDLSENPMLRDFSASVNPLNSIDFSYNLKLTEIGLNGTTLTRIPDLSFLRIGSLHMGGLARYMPSDYFLQFPELYSFNIDNFTGASLDLSQNPYLNSVWCKKAPNIEEINLTASSCSIIEHLHIRECPKLLRVLVRAGVTIRNIEKDDHTEIVYIEP